MPLANLNHIVPQVDPDRSGEIDYGEFIGFFLKKANDPALWGSGSGVSWQVMKQIRDKLDLMWGSIGEVQP